jgi:hypothetical protein
MTNFGNPQDGLFIFMKPETLTQSHLEAWYKGEEKKQPRTPQKQNGTFW